jgi:hypothetical protein
MPQHAKDQGRIPPKVLASSMIIYVSHLNKRHRSCALASVEDPHRFPSLHLFIVKTNESSKLLE